MSDTPQNEWMIWVDVAPTFMSPHTDSLARGWIGADRILHPRSILRRLPLVGAAHPLRLHPAHAMTFPSKQDAKNWMLRVLLRLHRVALVMENQIVSIGPDAFPPRPFEARHITIHSAAKISTWWDRVYSLRDPFPLRPTIRDLLWNEMPYGFAGDEAGRHGVLFDRFYRPIWRRHASGAVTRCLPFEDWGPGPRRERWFYGDATPRGDMLRSANAALAAWGLRPPVKIAERLGLPDAPPTADKPLIHIEEGV